MKQEIRLHSLAELGSVFGLRDPATDAVDKPTVVIGDPEGPNRNEESGAPETEPGPATDTLSPHVPFAQPGALHQSLVPVAEPEDTSALEAIIADLEGASDELDQASRQDQVALATAFAELETFDRLLLAQHQAEAAQERATHVREAAETLVNGAFCDEARASAAAVVVRATRAERQASALVIIRRGDVERFGARLDVQRLVAERNRRQASEAARVEADARALRLQETEAGVNAALDAGRLDDARVLLERAGPDLAESGALEALREAVARQATERQVTAAESALRLARNELRRCPEEAVAQLESLEVEGLPADLGRQVFGEWAAACSRVCRRRGYAEPLRYAPVPGRGAVLAREQPDGDYVVLSSLGMGSRWQPGVSVASRDVSGCRPLR